jgi:hypothetical protein
MALNCPIHESGWPCKVMG